MQLIYRGQLINYLPRPIQPYRKPYALNWRYQIPGETYSNTSRSIVTNKNFQTVNWRYRLAI